MITLLQLGTELGAEFLPATAGTFRALPVSGVHVSELEDPTAYLDGGELLLTTGMPFAASAEASRAYMRRLQAKQVFALGLGLGPWLNAVPEHVIEACDQAGIELGIVPDQIPFQNISRAYWRLASRDQESNLMGSLGTQTALARAAVRPDAINAVVRGLAEAVKGWAAYLSVDARPATCYPASAEVFLVELRHESMRFRRNGMPAASTFEVQGHEVVLYPILSGTRIQGYLGVSAGRKPTKADRQIIMTACTLLSLRARQRELAASTHQALSAATAKLLLHGQPEAARLVGEDAGLDSLPSRVRILVYRAGANTDAATALHALPSLQRPAALPDISAAVEECQLHYQDGSENYLVLPEPAEHPGTDAPLAPPAGSATEPMAREPFDSPAPEVQAVLSHPLNLAEIPANLPALRHALDAVPVGTMASSSPGFDASAETWVTALAEYPRADLLSAVTSYLRHRGHWEEASRELGIHRNSLRHRISVAQDVLGIDLDDPDAAASLWLALRRTQK
ncbi:PucR family transcriptional regulator [Glutamicibacter sp. HZAU]|uniref:PucR family transcriptional regulator n=1 Tax=Glutamicibacter sp. HZAU TaxID=2049891 RepID=UPI000FFC6D0B|nr:PucR family transcriptional regulator [Glutamicibacter sp. HZAU]RWZ82136.1 PucR family transcriptional regulator [Glutamicibacter sp. HZAU]